MEIIYFDQVEFGKKLHAVRKAQKLNQQELADLAGVEKHQISRIERGTSACSIDLLPILASILEVGIDYLMGMENRKVNTKKYLMNILFYCCSLSFFNKSRVLQIAFDTSSGIFSRIIISDGCT